MRLLVREMVFMTIPLIFIFVILQLKKKIDLKGKSLATTLMLDAKFDGANVSEVIMSKAYAMGASIKWEAFSNAVINGVNLGKLICMVRFLGILCDPSLHLTMLICRMQNL